MNICLTILFLAALIFPSGAIDARRGAAIVEAGGQTEKPPMFVLQIGISDYKYYPKLSGVADVLEMRRLLTGDAYKIPPENILTLCDDGAVRECGAGGAATKENIVRQFENHLIKNAREYHEKTGGQAVVVFEFSGHGSQTPDLNGDEKDDGKDETLVTVDSRDEAGKNFDITDDEIYDLTARLAPFTKNVVYILDSCTSGSGTRGADGVRGVAARKTAPVPVKTTAERNARGASEIKRTPDDAQTDMLPPSGNYIVLSAARAGELAQQKDVFECDTCRKKLGSYGYLTYYLVQELKNATAATTYRDVMENVKRKISADTYGSQTPQIEGDDTLPVFGNLSRVKNPGIEISKADANEITVEAGAMQGVTTGAVLEIYDVDDKKIANAKVTRLLSPNQSIAVIVRDKTGFQPTRTVSVEKRDRAILSAADFGAARLKILLDGEDAAKLTDADRNTIAVLRKIFAPAAAAPPVQTSGVVQATGGWRDKTARWDAALLKDEFGRVFPDRNRAAPTSDEKGGKSFPSDERQVFYLAGKDFTPLYGFYVEADRADAASKIERAIVHLTRLRSVKAIANDKSTLRRKITVKPFLVVNPKCENREVVAEKKYLSANKSKTAYEIAQGKMFGLEVSNSSANDLFITLIDISTDGGVKILAPRNIDGEKEGLRLAAGETKTFFGDDVCNVFVTSAPNGTETFKIIATTAKIERKAFEFLEQNAIARGDGATKSLTDSADWTTAEINFEIGAGE